jgi:hypothetical protein
MLRREFDSLQDQQVILTAEPSLQSLIPFLSDVFLHLLKVFTLGTGLERSQVGSEYLTHMPLILYYLFIYLFFSHTIPSLIFSYTLLPPLFSPRPTVPPFPFKIQQASQSLQPNIAY